MKTIGVIPARFGATRFPGKPLALIAGRPLLQWVIESVQQSLSLDSLLVATDDERIAKLSESLSVETVMTDSELPSGSDRVFAAVRGANDEDIVLNIQGDEPLICAKSIDLLAEHMKANLQDDMATLGRAFKNSDEVRSLQTAKIIKDKNDYALYFSRYPIPYSRIDIGIAEENCLKHIGVYAYRKKFLQRYCEQAPTSLEMSEGLEQLRALQMGGKIKVLKTRSDSWGVDVPEDVQKVENEMKKRKVIEA